MSGASFAHLVVAYVPLVPSQPVVAHAAPAAGVAAAAYAHLLGGQGWEGGRLERGRGGYGKFTIT